MHHFIPLYVYPNKKKLSEYAVFPHYIVTYLNNSNNILGKYYYFPTTSFHLGYYSILNHLLALIGIYLLMLEDFYFLVFLPMPYQSTLKPAE